MQYLLKTSSFVFNQWQIRFHSVESNNGQNEIKT